MKQDKKLRKSQKELRAEFAAITRRFESFHESVEGSGCKEQTDMQTEEAGDAVDTHHGAEDAEAAGAASSKRDRKPVVRFDSTFVPVNRGQAASAAASSVPPRSPKVVRDAAGALSTKSKGQKRKGTAAAAAAASASDSAGEDPASEEDMDDDPAYTPRQASEHTDEQQRARTPHNASHAHNYQQQGQCLQHLARARTRRHQVRRQRRLRRLQLLQLHSPRPLSR